MNHYHKTTVSDLLNNQKNYSKKSNEWAKWKGIYLSNAIKKYHKTGFIDDRDLLLKFFLQCLWENGIVVEKCEKPIQNKYFKGRVDAIGKMDGHKALIEVKCSSLYTNKDELIRLATIQLSLYEQILGVKYKKLLIIIDNKGRGYELLDVSNELHFDTSYESWNIYEPHSYEHETMYKPPNEEIKYKNESETMILNQTSQIDVNEKQISKVSNKEKNQKQKKSIFKKIKQWFRNLFSHSDYEIF